MQAPYFFGWTASVKLLHSDLVDAAAAVGRPLTVWVVDTEDELRQSWRLQPESLISNRPAWAQALLAHWLGQCRTGSTDGVYN